MTIALVALGTRSSQKFDDKAAKRRSRMSRVILGPADADAVKNKPWVRNSIVGLYYVLIALVTALESVEIARFVQSGQGIGLTPFVYGGCAIAVALRATKGFKNSVPGWQSASQLFWLVSAVVTVIKVVAVGRLLVFPNGRFARENTAYSTQMQLAIQVVLFIVYMLLLSVETLVQFFRPGYQSTLTRLQDVQTPEGHNGIEMTD